MHQRDPVSTEQKVTKNMLSILELWCTSPMTIIEFSYVQRL
jgi:hypothetical protein